MKKGFTLIELLIYAVLLVIIGTVTVSLFIQVVNVTETSRRSREALDNARRGLDVVSQEIKHARSVYTPTSVLNSASGQLSLETTRDLPSGETSTYVDFFVDGQRLYLKREGASNQLITSEKVKITQFNISLQNSASGNPLVQVKITAEYDNPISGPKNAVTLTSTTTLRSYE